ncbi:3435_t:CDS:2 [Ambispora gerdemannii]|uniref:3435_t:CDS:1 n=1 Tax=Ambispora gerdemannii TaxID=144530 RepID=A0A9N8YP56_9GLOM|nr:3435_t:CDS:2 [Ambispora gerdemannii]
MASKTLSFVRELNVTSATESKVSLELQVQKEHLNKATGLHGGLIATLIDIGGSLAIASKGIYNTGVSTDINVSFINAAKLNDVLTIEGKCEKLGKNLAFTSVDIHNKETGKIIAQGRHTKYIAAAHLDPKNIANLKL